MRFDITRRLNDALLATHGAVWNTIGRAIEEIEALRRQRDAAYAAIRDAFRCDECDQWATKRFHNGDQCCDLHATGDGWTDTEHAAAIRAAMTAVTP